MTKNFMNKYLVIIACLLLATTACKRETAPTVSRKDIRELAIKDIDFNYFSARSKINYDDGNNSLGATASIRMKKDSLIWISVSPGLGIEAARGLVTRDSIFLMNKFEKNYYAYSFAELSDKLNVALSYDVVQAALIGDMIRPMDRSNRIERMDQQTVVIQQEPLLDIANYISHENMKLTKVILQDKEAVNSLMLSYDDFKSLDEKMLPFSSIISANYRDNQELKTTTIAFKHNKAEFSETALSFPFDIPDKYDRKN